MIRKKIHSIIIAAILLFSIAFIICPSTNAANQHSVKGIVYVRDEIPVSPMIENMQVKIVFISGTETSEVYEFDLYNDNTNYNVGFQGHEGEIGDIKVEYYGIDYIPTDNTSITIESGVTGYYIILHIEPPEDLPPSKVTGLTVTDAKDGKLNLAWSPATDDNGIDHYNIYQTGTGLIDTTTSTSYQDTGLTNGQSYEYQVSAVDTIGQEGEKSDPASGTPTESTTPTPPGPTPPGPTPPGPPALDSPTADAGGDEEDKYYGVVGEVITFDGSGSNDPDGDIVSYEWDFDDDGEYDDGTGVSPTYSWSAKGTYSIKLKVTDDDDKTGTDEATVIISQLNNDPTDPIVTGTTEGSINTDYKYTAVSTDPDPDDKIRYIFDWNDTTDDTVTDYAENNTQVNATHNWSTPNLYVLTVQAEDNNSGISGKTKLLVFIDTDYEEQDNGTYYLDTDKDGDWDQIYDPETGSFSEYIDPDLPAEEPSDDGDQDSDSTIWYVLGIIIIIIFILLALLGTRKKEEPKDKKPKDKKTKK